MRRRWLGSAAALFFLLPGLAAAQTAGAYLQAVSNLIAAQQVYPAKSKRLGEEGEVRLRLTLDRQGNPIDIGVRKSSGYPALDQAAAEMARRAFPVPPPPDELKGEPIVFDAPVLFRLED